MSEPLTPSTGDEAYQPISGLALGGLILSAGFAALVLLSAAVAVLKGAPLFYPTWLLLAPIAAFVLCLVGRNQIINSDGTRAGMKLAHWGLALALFSGLGYAAYFITVGYAVAAQSHEFLAGEPGPERGFLTHLTRAGKNPDDLDIAFLLTRPASGRVKFRPGDHEIIVNTYDQPTSDGGAGQLTTFRNLLLVRMLSRAGDQAVIEPLGVHSWSHDQGSYKVARNYRIATPEAVLDMILQSGSTEAEAEGQLRQWFVNLMESPIKSRTLTPLGKIVDELREQSTQFLDNKWRPRLAEGKAFPDFAQSDKSDWKRLFPDSAEALKAGKILPREYYQSKARDLFAGKSRQPFAVNYDLGGWPIWGADEKGHFWIDAPIRLLLDGTGELQSAWAEATLKVRTREPFDPSKVTPPAPTLEWDVTEVTILRVRAAKGMP